MISEIKKTQSKLQDRYALVFGAGSMTSADIGWSRGAPTEKGLGVGQATALIYARKRPDPWPEVFGFHEAFHTCTVIGAGIFAYVIAFIALPRY